MKAMTKKQLAKAAGVTVRTLNRWLKDPFMREQMRPFHLKKQQRILPPAAVKIICEHYVIEID